MEVITTPEKSHLSFALSLRYALRELRSGFSGFAGFLFCLALGVGGIGIVGSFSQAIRSGLVEEGRVLLGGDIELALAHRQASKAERLALETHGKVSEIATLRAMVTVPGKKTQSLIEIKAIDDHYPLYGDLKFDENTVNPKEGDTAANLLRISVESTLLASLKIKLGERVKIGSQYFIVGETIEVEPDRMSSGFLIGPRVLMSKSALDKTELIQPGSLIRWRYRIRFSDTASSDVDDIAENIKTEFPKSG